MESRAVVINLHVAFSFIDIHVLDLDVEGRVHELGLRKIYLLDPMLLHPFLLTLSGFMTYSRELGSLRVDLVPFVL